MNKAEFDRHAGTYRAVHEANIALSGESPDYFADYKMRDFAQLVTQSGLPPDGSYLDFGSGIGNSVAPFRAHLPTARLTCADVSHDSLSIGLAMHGDAAQFVWLEDGKLPLPDASVDGAFACCVFHHISPEQHRDALVELRRVIKPGGLLMLYEHNPFNPLTVRAVNTCPLDENAVLIRATRLQQSCQHAGFNVYRRAYRVFFPAALKALRPMERLLHWLPLGAQYFVAVRA